MYHLKSIWAIKGKYMAVVKMVGSLFGSIKMLNKWIEMVNGN